MLNMFDDSAHVKLLAVEDDEGEIPLKFIGLDRFEARSKVVDAITALGLLEKVEDRVVQTPYGDRSGVVIEPWLTDQWYVDAKTLAGPAIEAVRSGAIDVVPKSWEKTYFNWMENIQPWCVSRQLWWGHRIPAYFGPMTTKGVPGAYVPGITPHFVAESREAAIDKAKAAYVGEFEVLVVDSVSVAQEATNAARDDLENGRTQRLYLYQDSDVLDTWFSSALWPFGTLGWPEADAPLPLAGGAGGGPVAQAHDESSGSQTLVPTPNPSRKREGNTLLTRHYPGDVLVSGFDILFFWDARMIMQGLHFMEQAPFKTLYLHGLVRAADGSKMSKSKGNTVDPLGLIDQYGADALRFFMAAMESQGRDIKMDESRVTGYRNFATKLWNAARFCQSNGIGASASVAAPVAELAVNKWIIGEVVETLTKLNRAFEELRFDGMADTIYHFAWGTFCDWYLELIKPGFVDGEKGEMDSESRHVAGWVFDQILVMLHPFMPFITEELWGAMGDRGGNMIIHAQWPAPDANVDAEAKAEIDWLIELVSKIRAARSELAIPPSTKMELYVYSDEQSLKERYLRHADVLIRMARLTRTQFSRSIGSPTQDGGPGIEGASITVALDGVSYRLPLEGIIDTTAERTRLTAAITAITKERDSLAGRLNNPAFVEKAKPEAVEKARADHGEKAAEAERLQAALARLG
jgi:valyl-tRNA synthetase